MSWKIIAPLVLCLATVVHADPDPAAYQKQTQDIERREKRELQKVDQAEEQDRIKLRTRERDALAQVQRDNAVIATGASASVMATGNLASIDTTKLAQAKFNEDEVHNMINNQATPEMMSQYTLQRAAINRKYALERAKLDADQLTGDDAAKQKDLAIKTAELNAKYQEQYDNLANEQAGEEAKLRFAQTTKVNAAERDLAAMTAKYMFDQSKKGAAASFNITADPDYLKLTAARDQVKSALDTALDELRAKYNAKRTDIDNAKEDEQAKLSGG
jgi:hypothetical protein